MFAYEIRVPKDRVAVIIGTKGETKQLIEEETNTSIDVDSKDGIVTVSGEDALLLYSAQNIIKAIARGFNPEIALNLLKQDWVFELIDLTQYSTKKNHQQRMKGRVIGASGKSRQVIEDLTESAIVVYGKTIGIISPAETIGMAKQAVEALLDGANHATVYKTLEKKRRNLKMSRVMGVE